MAEGVRVVVRDDSGAVVAEVFGPRDEAVWDACEAARDRLVDDSDKVTVEVVRGGLEVTRGG